MRIHRVVAVLILALSFTGTLYARHRSAPALPVTEVEGVLKSISATQIVVTDEKGNDVTFTITPDTIFRSGDMAIDPTTLTNGDSVEVKGVTKDNELDALVVQLDTQEQEKPELVELTGTVKSATATELVVTDAKGNDTTFTITDGTMIQKNGKPATAADLATGDHVEVKAVQSGTALNALFIKDEDKAQQPEPQFIEVNGFIKSVSATEVVVTDRNQHDTTFEIVTTTMIRRLGKSVAPTDLVVGDQVEVKAIVNGTVNNAIFINAVPAPSTRPQQAEVNGTVKTIGANSITVTTKSGDVTVNIDSNTKITKDDQTIAIGDIKVGDRVQAQGTRVDATTINATRIEVSSGGD